MMGLHGLLEGVNVVLPKALTAVVG